MSECEICGRPQAKFEGYVIGWSPTEGGCWREAHDDDDAACYRIGYERTLARADRYEAEFSACKALLIAAQKRAERAEAERAAAEEALEDWRVALAAAFGIETADPHYSLTRLAADLEVHHQEHHAREAAAEQKASEARALALREAADEVLRDLLAPLHVIAARLRALAALPVEPARRQVTEITQRAPSARSPAMPEEGR